MQRQMQADFMREFQLDEEEKENYGKNKKGK